ncbi:MAG: hypothetical protein GX616_26025 [Planctomycetes bacterium]|nr:hypothetical protein [Planctomycetota bacterium]
MKTTLSRLNAEIRILRLRRLLGEASLRLWAVSARYSALPLAIRRWRATLPAGVSRPPGQPRSRPSGGFFRQMPATVSGQLLLSGIADLDLCSPRGKPRK